MSSQISRPTGRCRIQPPPRINYGDRITTPVAFTFENLDINNFYVFDITVHNTNLGVGYVLLQKGGHYTKKVPIPDSELVREDPRYGNYQGPRPEGRQFHVAFFGVRPPRSGMWTLMCFATQVPSSGSDEEREPFAVAMALTQGFEVVHSRDCPNPVQGLPGKHMEEDPEEYEFYVRLGLRDYDVAEQDNKEDEEYEFYRFVLKALK